MPSRIHRVFSPPKRAGFPSGGFDKANTPCQPEHMRSLVVLLLSLLAYGAHAEIKWTQAQGYSQIQGFGINNNASVVILGGFAGPATFEVNGVATACNVNANTTITCNSCTATIPQQCNQTRVYPEMNLQMTFSSTSVTAGTPRLTFKRANETTSTIVQNFTSTVQTTSAANQAVTITVKWADLCASMDENGLNTCAAIDESMVFQMGLDAVGSSQPQLDDSEDDAISFTVVAYAPDSTFNTTTAGGPGLSNFSFFPGDEKAYIENVTIGSGTVRPIKKVHFLCQSETNGGFASIVGTDIIASIGVLNGTLTDTFITGLQNGEVYACKAASEDDAGNIGLYLQDTTTCPTGVTPISGLTSCRQVKPDAVGGLFKDNCFIATAAYGSLFEPNVKVLRTFRDKFLKPHFLGQKFIDAYYTVSPPIANWIAQSETRRSLTRFALTPVVYSVKMFMYAPFMFVCGVLMIYAFAIAVAVRRHRQPVRYKGNK